MRRLWPVERAVDAAFAGVYGDTPQRLYGRFSAELSENAMTVARAWSPARP